VISVIGLGQTGSDIADLFAQYPQYSVYKILVGKKKGKRKNSYTLLEQPSPEEYESNCPSLKSFFKDIKGQVLFVVDGSELVSSSSLQILSQIRQFPITVLYVKPDTDFLPERNKLSENAVRGVLQEYARSAVFERIFLVDKTVVAASLGEIPIKSYHQKIYQAIVSTMHMINVFSRSPVVMGTSAEPIGVARISTFGFADFETGKENLFFPLDFSREKNYYYAFNEDKLANEGKLLSRVKENVLSQSHEKLKTTYAVYETQYEEDYVYVLSHSSMVQV
jgi:hypothetical protein